MSTPKNSKVTLFNSTMSSTRHLLSTNLLLHWHYSQLEDHNFQVNGGQTLFCLFITLLLYARWYFRFRRQNPAVTLYHVTLAESRGLDSATIKAMPIILHQRDDHAMECCICLGVFEEGDKVKVLMTCQHRFHSDCVDRWLATQSSCPLCRVSLQVDSSLHIV